MDAGLVVAGLAGDLAVPSADPQPLEPDIAADIRQVQPRQRGRLVACDLQVGQLLPLGEKTRMRPSCWSR